MLLFADWFPQGDMSISLWARLFSHNNNEASWMFSLVDTAGADFVGALNQAPQINDGQVSLVPGAWVDVGATSWANDMGGWHHATIVLHADGSSSQYYDGALIGTSPHALQLGPTSSVVLLIAEYYGASSFPSPFGADGEVLDFAVWPYALDAAQVALVHSRSPRTLQLWTTSPAPIQLLRDVSGGQFEDIAGGGRHVNVLSQPAECSGYDGVTGTVCGPEVCDGKACGSDTCGGSCGQCLDYEVCYESHGVCLDAKLCPPKSVKHYPGKCGWYVFCFTSTTFWVNQTTEQLCGWVGCTSDLLDSDIDGDGALDFCAWRGTPQDQCHGDANKFFRGACGCGVPDTDSDGDGALDNCDTEAHPQDECPHNPNLVLVGDHCECSDGADSDGDGVADCADACPANPLLFAATEGCDCSAVDGDSDGVPDCIDACPQHANAQPGVCGCGGTDRDGDGALDCVDECPDDSSKTARGVCGCGVAEVDSDADGSPDCVDQCPHHAVATEPGPCGCGVTAVDRDGDGVVDCGGSDENAEQWSCSAWGIPCGTASEDGPCRDDVTLACVDFLPGSRQCPAGSTACRPAEACDVGTCARGSVGECFHSDSGSCGRFLPGTRVCPALWTACAATPSCVACSHFTSGPCQHNVDDSCLGFIPSTRVCPSGSTACGPPADTQGSEGGSGSSDNGASAHLCTTCEGLSSGPCQSYDGSCFGYAAPSSRVCPAGTVACGPVEAQQVAQRVAAGDSFVLVELVLSGLVEHRLWGHGGLRTALEVAASTALGCAASRCAHVEYITSSSDRVTVVGLSASGVSDGSVQDLQAAVDSGAFVQLLQVAGGAEGASAATVHSMEGGFSTGALGDLGGLNGTTSGGSGGSGGFGDGTSLSAVPVGGRNDGEVHASGRTPPLVVAVMLALLGVCVAALLVACVCCCYALRRHKRGRGRVVVGAKVEGKQHAWSATAVAGGDGV